MASTSSLLVWRDGRLLSIVDEFTREVLAIRVDCSITADETVSVLDGSSPSMARRRTFAATTEPS